MVTLFAEIHLNTCNTKLIAFVERTRIGHSALWSIRRQWCSTVGLLRLETSEVCRRILA